MWLSLRNSSRDTNPKYHVHTEFSRPLAPRAVMRGPVNGSLQQTIRAVNQTSAQLAFQHESFQLEQRPYLAIKVMKFGDINSPSEDIGFPVKDRPLIINMSFQNVGKSPALNMITHRHLIFSAEHIRDIKGEPADKRIGGTIVQGELFTTTAVSIKDTYANETAKLSSDEIMN
jgi:hypothetical protein